MKNRFFIAIIIFFVIIITKNISFGQIQSDMMKYWFYRNRLNYFAVPGEKIGESQIVCIRNEIGAYNDPNQSTNPDQWTNVDYGQHGKHDGLYIGVLATEYYLLNMNGQTVDAAKTLTELNEALNAVIVYWDSLAEPFWGFGANYNGFFVRGNVPCDFLDATDAFHLGHGTTINGKSHLSLLNKWLDTSDTWNPYTNKFGNFPKGHPGYADHRTNTDCGGTSIYSDISPSGGYSNIYPDAMSQDEAIIILLGASLAHKLGDVATQIKAKTMCDKILTYILNMNLYNGPLPYEIYKPNITHSDGGWSTYTHSPGLFRCGSQTTGYSKYQTWALWEGAGQWIGWQLCQLGLGNKDLTATTLAMGDFAAGKIERLTNRKLNWDSFYLLLWEVLNNDIRNTNHQKKLLDKSLTQMDNAPCDGPYNYGNGNYATGGWASDYRWFKGADDQDGSNPKATLGNFNGVDYMLLYNLYHIMTNNTSPFYVSYINRNLVGTVNTSGNFIGYSTIVSNQVVNNASTVNYKAGDSIHLKAGFHAVAGANFHAYIGEVTCSDAQSITPYYDSLISQYPKATYPSSEKDDTTLDNNITLPCPNDTIKLTGKICDTCRSFYWDFGNGQTSTLQYPKVFYATPGNYNITVIFTDTNGVADTALFTVVVPDCTIYGTLTENPSCGGATIIGEIMYISDSTGTYRNDTITPVTTSSNGFFRFDPGELKKLCSWCKYTITSSSGKTLIEGTSQKILDWINQSPLHIYYNTGTVDTMWVARYNGADSLEDIANAIDLQGNVYVTGSTNTKSSYYNMLTIKYDPSGDTLWTRRYTGNNQQWNDIARAITADASGNAYITGESYPSDVPTITTLCYSTNGTRQWVQTYGRTNTTSKCILLDHDGNVIVGGTTLLTDGTGSSVYTILKYSSAGTLIWSANYNPNSSTRSDILTAISVDANNNIYASGYSQGGSTNYDMLTVRFNPDGSQPWSSPPRYDTASFNDYAYSNTIDNNGNIIVAGYSHESNGNDEIRLISYSPSGAQKWTKHYSTDAHDYAYKILYNNAGSIYIGGYSGTTSSSGLLALKYDTIGNFQWYKNSLSGNYFVFKSAALDQADNLYITGTTKPFLYAFTDITTQKLNNTGNIQWTKTYNGPGNSFDSPTQVTVSVNGNVYVSGECTGNNTNYDFTTIKYKQCLSTANLLKPNNNTNNDVSPNITNTVREKPSIQVIPNPNNGNMQVVYEIPENTTGIFEVYNLIGNKLFSYPLYGGKNTFLISRSDINPGIYFYRATAGNKIIAKDKIVVIK